MFPVSLQRRGCGKEMSSVVGSGLCYQLEIT